MAYLGRPGATAPLTAADIPDNSITAAKIVADTIAAGDIGNDAVGTAELANDVVISTSGAITTTGGMTVDGATVFNEASADVDFRVEGNGNANLFYVDAGNDRIGIGTATPDTLLHLESSLTIEPTIKVVDTNGDGAGPQLYFKKDGGSAVTNDEIGRIRFDADNANGGAMQWFNIIAYLADATASSEKSKLSFIGREAVGEVVPMTINGSKVGIGTSDPSYPLHVICEAGSGIKYALNLGAGTGCSDGPAIRFDCGAGPAEIAGLRACLGGTAYGSEFVFKTSRWTGSAISYTHVMTMQHNGDLLSYTGSDSIGTLSDKRLKKNIEDFSYSLDTFKQLETKTFEWINPDAHASSGEEIGFLAQDVKLIDSRWVSDSFIDQDHPDYDLIQDTHITDVDENENETLIGKTTATILGRKDVMYISVIQQLLGKVETLEAKVTALESA